MAAMRMGAPCPAGQSAAPDERTRMSGIQRFLKWLLPARWFEAIRTGTKLWVAECPCGHVRDYWEAGGIRYKAAGEPRQIAKCPACGKMTWHRVRKKTEQELKELL